MSDSDGCGTGISQPCTTKSNNGCLGWLLSIHENPEILHSWSNTHVALFLPLTAWAQPQLMGCTQRRYEYMTKESPAPTLKAELEISSVLISRTGLSAQPESVYSNNSRSVRNISHPWFYSSPASLCMFFIRQRACTQIQHSPLWCDVHLGHFVLHLGDDLWVPRVLNVTPGTSREGRKAAVCILNPENIF